MGNLVTFTLLNATAGHIAKSGDDIVDALNISLVTGYNEQDQQINGMTLRVFPCAHADFNVTYVQHGGGLQKAFPPQQQINKFLKQEYKRVRAMDLGTPFEQRPLPALTRLEDALCTVTIYTDSLDRIERHPEQFAIDIATALQRSLLGDERHRHYCLGQTIVQKPLHKDAQAVYICSGNTMVWFDSNSTEMARLKQDVPEFYRDLKTVLRYSIDSPTLTWR